MDPFIRLFTYPYRLFHPHDTSPSRSAQREGYFRLAEAPDQLKLVPPQADLLPMANYGTLPEELVDAVHHLKPFLPIGCEFLGQDDLKIVGPYPIDAGGLADVWAGEKTDGTRLAIKSHRCYSSSSHLPVYLRLYREALICSYFNDNNNPFVSFIGVYSTQEHPFALVFKFMDHLNLSKYLKDNWDVGRIELLLEIARGLKHMHNLGFVHGNLKITNVLVGGDGHVHIAGLGTAFIPSSMPAMELDRSFYGAAPELIEPQRWGCADTGATMASDVFAFAILAWEVFAGRPPFSGEHAVAALHSMLNGRRPARPEHPELSDRMWKMIKGSWKGNPAQRNTITEVITILEVEASAR